MSVCACGSRWVHARRYVHVNMGILVNMCVHAHTCVHAYKRRHTHATAHSRHKKLQTALTKHKIWPYVEHVYTLEHVTESKTTESSCSQPQCKNRVNTSCTVQPRRQRRKAAEWLSLHYSVTLAVSDFQHFRHCCRDQYHLQEEAGKYHAEELCTVFWCSFLRDAYSNATFKVILHFQSYFPWVPQWNHIKFFKKNKTKTVLAQNMVYFNSFNNNNNNKINDWKMFAFLHVKSGY